MKSNHEMLSLLNLDTVHHFDADLSVSCLEVHPTSYIDEIALLIEQAHKDGVSWRQIAPHLLVECTDFPRAVELGMDSALTEVRKCRAQAEAWRNRGDHVSCLSSEEKYQRPGVYAPFSIYPLPELARIKLSTGAIYLVAYLNVSEVFRFFEAKGWLLLKPLRMHTEEVLASDHPENHGMGTVKKGPLSFSIPGPMIGRLGYEFLKPQTLVDDFEAQLSTGPPKTPYILTRYSHEHELWD